MAKKYLSDQDSVARVLEPLGFHNFTVTTCLVDKYVGVTDQYVEWWDLKVKVTRASTVSIQFTGSRSRFLVCVRRVFACMAQGGAPYGPR